MLKRKMLILIASFVVVMCMQVCVYAENEESLLSDMSEDECIEFLQEKGVDIQDDYLNEESFGLFVKGLIEEIESISNWVNTFNMTSTYELAEQIKEVVYDYYNIAEIAGIQLYSSGYTLTDSTFYNWTSGCPGFNCYTYAIGRASDGVENPGYKINMNVSTNTNVATIAGMVTYDLRDLGYTSATAYTSLPTSLPSGSKVICVRTWVLGGAMYDYHFMSMSSSAWYHKPGRTAILKYKYQPSMSRNWTNESAIMSYSQIIYSAPTHSYTSDIYYIVYK